MKTTRRSLLASGSVLASSALLPLATVGEVVPAQAHLGRRLERLKMLIEGRLFADADDHLMYQRAIEAVIWSMPALSDVYFREFFQGFWDETR